MVITIMNYTALSLKPQMYKRGGIVIWENKEQEEWDRDGATHENVYMNLTF